MAIFPSAIIKTNHTIFTASARSRHASQQKKVINPQYASYNVAIDHGLATNAGRASHKLCCKLVRIVITNINTKIKPNSTFRNSFTRNLTNRRRADRIRAPRHSVSVSNTCEPPLPTHRHNLRWSARFLRVRYQAFAPDDHRGFYKSEDRQFPPRHRTSAPPPRPYYTLGQLCESHRRNR